jgi:hypothetical protein
MMPSEPSNILFWTYQDISGHDGMDEQDISWRKWLVLMGISA